MYQKCSDCKKNYIEENEELCVECAVWFAEENEYTSKYFDELVVGKVNGDMLNDLGASVSSKDY